MISLRQMGNLNPYRTPEPLPSGPRVGAMCARAIIRNMTASDRLKVRPEHRVTFYTAGYDQRRTIVMEHEVIDGKDWYWMTLA